MSVAQAEPPAFLLYTTFVKFASIHVLPSAPFCCGNMPEPGSDQHHSRVTIRKAADAPGSVTNLFYDAFEIVICPDVIVSSVAENSCSLLGNLSGWDAFSSDGELSVQRVSQKEVGKIDQR